MGPVELYEPTRARQLANNVGIVVIGRNEGDRLIGCLTSIDPRKFVTIYVDSGSTDSSVEVASRLGANVVRLDLARPFTAARARNEGFATLKALRPNIRFVQFVDGDCELDSDWLELGLAFMEQNKNIGVICGRRRERYPEASIYNWLCDVEWNTPTGEALASGGDSLVRAAAFDAVDGFQSRLIAGEEPEFCLRLRQIGWKIWRLDTEMTRHDAAMTHFTQWWQRAVRGGYAYAEIFRLHARSPSAIWITEFSRAFLWGGLFPMAIVLSALVKPIAIAAVIIYPLQISRIAMRQGALAPRSWTYAIFMTLGKFAEFQGILIYLWRTWRGQTLALIEYKGIR